MKTVRILLFPDAGQTMIMEDLVGRYCDCLLRCSEEKRWDSLCEEMTEIFCATTYTQLQRDICRRIHHASSKKMRIPHRYCRWGNDYRLTETLVVLPLGEGFGIRELKIACIYRPFQLHLLDKQHPETLILKRMKKHWFAYVLVEGDN
ncbi:MAG: hypothetical protein E4G74_02085 [Erysipelotrichales bacterium]|nr:MAG: hypothetical protein E4G74_02085 [Erysipelotrichales bacterium]